MAGRRNPTVIIWTVGYLLFGAMLVASLASNAWLAHRFVHHSETVDARLIERISPPNCLGASGVPGLSGRGANTWLVEFPTRDGLHRTQLVHPCRVTPPDFGRGRGYMWMQYDVDNPDRTRVLNDTTHEDDVEPFALAVAAWAIIGTWWWRWRGSRRRGSARGG
ncbi:hypothetical protein [Aestuariimicrobium ganziense]|uniref:hypothetical protein n=1 Tax=Aestuariimicrobium ganziense TaxID=2773677 RepID=UPI001940560F|nr:hypothetical protein [Aestuariimicrobium ganziense]